MIALGLPYLVCSVAYVLFSSVMSSDMHTPYSFDAIMGLWKNPVAQYWYLYALLEMFLVVPIIEFILHRVDRRWILLLFTIFALCIHVNVNCINYFTSYTCFFYMGTCFNQFDITHKFVGEGENHYRLLGLSCMMGMVIYAVYEYIEVNKVFSFEIRGVLNVIAKLLLVITVVGVSIAVSRMNNCLNKFLVWLAQYSLYVYLFHTWFSGTLRVLLRKTGILNSWVQTICGIAVGMAGSLCVAIIIKKVPFFQFWFEPLRTVRKK